MQKENRVTQKIPQSQIHSSYLLRYQSSFPWTKMFCNRILKSENSNTTWMTSWIFRANISAFQKQCRLSLIFEVMHSIHFHHHFPCFSLSFLVLLHQLDLFTAWDFRCLQGAFVLDTPHTLNHIHQHRFWKIHLLIPQGREGVQTVRVWKFKELL